MSRKINTFDKAVPGCSVTGYIKPEPLTLDERQKLLDHAGPLLEQLEYSTEAIGSGVRSSAGSQSASRP